MYFFYKYNKLKKSDNKNKKFWEGVTMKFIKGFIFGTAISAGAWMLYSEATKPSKNKFMKQGRKFMKNMGMM